MNEKRKSKSTLQINPQSRFSIFPFLSVVTLGFFLFPFLYLLFNLQALSVPDLDDFFWALRNTLLQSFFSTLLAAALGFLYIDGMLYAQRTFRLYFMNKIFISLFMLPSFLPAIFILLIFFSVFEPFPFGTVGVVLIHSFMYSGLFAVAFFNVIQQKANGLFEVSYLLGAKSTTVYRQVIRMLGSDITLILILIFTLCFTSFSIPLTVGGGRGTTLEVLIYEKMKLSGNWTEAYVLSLFQTILIAIVSYFLMRAQRLLKNSYRLDQFHSPLYYGTIFGFIIAIGYLAFFILSFLYFSISGIQDLLLVPEILDQIFQYLPLTIGIGLISGLVFFLFFLGSAISVFYDYLRKFFIFYIPVSVSLVGLCFIFLSAQTNLVQICYYIIATVLLFFVGLYKLGFAQELSALHEQVEVATLLGGSKSKILRKIIYPQVIPAALKLSGIAALWVVGDFAICQVIFTRNYVLSQLVEDLMTSYRIPAATTLMAVVLFIGLILYLLFLGASHVYRQKFS